MWFINPFLPCPSWYRYVASYLSECSSKQRFFPFEKHQILALEKSSRLLEIEVFFARHQRFPALGWSLFSASIV